MRTLFLQLTRYQHNDPWGFKLHGGVDFNSPIIVCSVAYGGQAYKAGLHEGDQVIGIGNEPTSYMTHDMAQQAIVRSANDLHMQIARQESSTMVSGGCPACISPPCGASMISQAPCCNYATYQQQPSSCPACCYSGGGSSSGCNVCDASRFRSQTQLMINENVNRHRHHHHNAEPLTPTRHYAPPPPVQQPKYEPPPPPPQPKYEPPPPPPPQPVRSPPMSFNSPSPQIGPASPRLAQIKPMSPPYQALKPSPFANPTRPYGSGATNEIPTTMSPPPINSPPFPKPVETPSKPRPIVQPPDYSAGGDKANPRRGKNVIRTEKAAAGTVPICQSCKIKIRGPFMASLDYCFCPDHFVCVRCERNLEECGFVEDRGYFHCEDCYAKFLAPSCAKCSKVITEEVTHAMEKTFHPQCFVCTKCNKKLGEGTFRIGDEGLAYCEKDWMEVYETKCDKCGTAIEAIDKVIEIGGQTMHSRCFCCSACQVSLDGKKFVTKNGKPYCKTHAKAGALF